MRSNSGFTLIELMIVVAIVGIISSIALPAYQSYMARAQVSEAISLASGLKTAVAGAAQESGSLSGINSGSNGIPNATDVAGKYVEQIDVVAGNITVTMRDVAAGVHLDIAAKTLIFEAAIVNDGVRWSCGAGSSMPAIYQPKNC
jgi:type IV pilus assembly protein PilA